MKKVFSNLSIIFFLMLLMILSFNCTQPSSIVGDWEMTYYGLGGTNSAYSNQLYSFSETEMTWYYTKNTNVMKATYSFKIEDGIITLKNDGNAFTLDKNSTYVQSGEYDSAPLQKSYIEVNGSTMTWKMPYGFGTYYKFSKK